MALASIYPFLSPLSAPSPHSFKLFPTTPSSLFLFLTRNSSPPPPPPSSIAHHLRANSSKRDGVSMESSASTCLDKELLRRVAGAKDADQAMDFIVEAQGRVGGGEVGNEDCRLIIAAVIDRENVELALSVFHAMRSGFGQGLSETITSVERWSWARPDVRTCALLVQGLAASLRVSDAIRIITNVSQVGVSSYGEEVPFGMIVPCLICTIAVAVAQPQQGIQVASCSKCRYQYQLISGDIVSIDSEVISMGKGFEIPTNNGREYPCCSSLHCAIIKHTWEESRGGYTTTPEFLISCRKANNKGVMHILADKFS